MAETCACEQLLCLPLVLSLYQRQTGWWVGSISGEALPLSGQEESQGWMAGTYCDDSPRMSSDKGNGNLITRFKVNKNINDFCTKTIVWSF